MMIIISTDACLTSGGWTRSLFWHFFQGWINIRLRANLLAGQMFGQLSVQHGVMTQQAQTGSQWISLYSEGATRGQQQADHRGTSQTTGSSFISVEPSGDRKCPPGHTNHNPINPSGSTDTEACFSTVTGRCFSHVGVMFHICLAFVAPLFVLGNGFRLTLGYIHWIIELHNQYGL